MWNMYLSNYMKVFIQHKTRALNTHMPSMTSDLCHARPLHRYPRSGVQGARSKMLRRRRPLRLEPRPLLHVVQVHLNLVIENAHCGKTGLPLWHAPCVAIPWGGELHVASSAGDGIVVLYLDVVQSVVEVTLVRKHHLQCW